MKKIYNQQITKLKWLDKLLFKAAGADLELLAKCSYSIRVMYFCLGGIVLSAGVLAFLSGSYAMYTVFSPKSLQSPESIYWGWVAISVLVGAFYGYVIFNLERYIVSSTGKGDGTDNITWKELKNALPRIILSVVIAVTVSKPLEIRIFQSEIDAVLNEKRIEYRDRLREGVDEKYKDRIEKIEDDKAKLEEEKEHLTEVKDELQAQYVEEARIVTVGPRARALKEEVIDAEADIVKVENEIKEKDASLEEILAEREEERAMQEQTATMLDGLLERILISHEIGGWIPWFITALFVALDVTPIFFKMMLVRNTYDYYRENEELLGLAYAGIETKPGFYSIDEEGNTVDHTTFYEPEVLKTEKIEKFKKQKSLIQKIIDLWHKREDKRIDDNLDDYLEPEAV